MTRRNNLYQSPRSKPATQNRDIVSNQPSTSEKPQDFGLFGGFQQITSAINNAIFGAHHQKPTNDGDTYNSGTPIKQTNQKFVTGGYSSKQAQQEALKKAMQESASKNPDAWSRAGASSATINAAVSGSYNPYRPYQAGQQAAVISSPAANISQSNKNAQNTTNAHPYGSITQNDYVISETQAGTSGGFNGNISIEGNTNVGLDAIRIPNLETYASGGIQTDTDTSATINQTQNKFSTDLPMNRQSFSKASEKISWKVGDHIHAAIPPTDPRWNMKQNLYQKATQAEDPLIEIQNNPQLKPSRQYMQQQGANVTQLETLDTFSGNYEKDHTLDSIKESKNMPYLLVAAAVAGFLFLRGRK